MKIIMKMITALGLVFLLVGCGRIVLDKDITMENLVLEKVRPEDLTVQQKIIYWELGSEKKDVDFSKIDMKPEEFFKKENQVRMKIVASIPEKAMYDFMKNKLRGDSESVSDIQIWYMVFLLKESSNFHAESIISFEEKDEELALRIFNRIKEKGFIEEEIRKVIKEM